jgi:DNA-binding protein WhiA
VTFSSKVKKELCSIPIERKCCAVAEAYGVLLFCNSFTPSSVKIVTENNDFSDRLPQLFQRAFGVASELKRIPGVGSKTIFSLTDEGAIESIYETVSSSTGRSIATHVNFGVLEEDHCRSAFLRGAFLAGGAVTNPEAGYHLELTTTHFHVCKEVCALMVDMDMEPKETVRKSNYVIYFKNSGMIEDFLTVAGAPVCAMELMSAKIYKDVRNEMNRRVNCDLANTDKTVEAAQAQIAAIRAIEAGPGLDSLGPKLKQTALLRLENPEATLVELCGMYDPPLRKSCLNHRMRRILAIAREI